MQCSALGCYDIVIPCFMKPECEPRAGHCLSIWTCVSQWAYVRGLAHRTGPSLSLECSALHGSCSQVNLVMWATQPVLTAALNKEFRTKKPSDSDKGLYPQIVVCPIPNPEPVRALPDHQTDTRSVPLQHGMLKAWLSRHGRGL